MGCLRIITRWVSFPHNVHVQQVPRRTLMTISILVTDQGLLRPILQIVPPLPGVHRSRNRPLG
jgi:hypothetical protein